MAHWSVLNRPRPSAHAWIWGALLALASSCAIGSAAIDGVVVNQADGRPIADAFVIVTWRYVGSDGLGSRSSCARIEIHRSNGQGRFAVAPRELDGLVNIVVYKPGYERYLDGRTTRTNEEYEKGLARREMVPFEGSAEKRMQQLDAAAGVLDCRSADIMSLVRPLYQALDEEVVSLGGRPIFMKSLAQRERILEEHEKRKRSGIQ